MLKKAEEELTKELIGTNIQCMLDVTLRRKVYVSDIIEDIVMVR